MFTGIIEEIGTIKQVKSVNDAMQLTINAKTVINGVKLGDSISVDGVCLTVTKFDKNSFNVDIMPETFKATTLSLAKIGSYVNLERALAVGDHLGGHFVSGHIDGVGIINKIEPHSNALYLTIDVGDKLTKYCINKGSIAIDGISLTIFGIDKNFITLSLIPHTLKHTSLGKKNIGNKVNIECDMLGKYVLNSLSKNSMNSNKIEENNRIDENFLNRNGFI